MKEPITLSTLCKTWIFDLDGTLVRHNGYKYEKDKLLPGVRNFFKSIDKNDTVIIVTSRKEEFRAVTEDFLKESNIWYNEIIFNLPAGERILFNDNKPSGLKTAVAVACDRDKGLEKIRVIFDERL
jgi:ribonucleotide monophosphatase NagD (HAD superfamily)